MTIRIEGLTPRQKELMDVIWGFETMDDVQLFINTLPQEDARDAANLVRVAIIETIDQGVTTLEDCSTARDLLDQFRL